MGRIIALALSAVIMSSAVDARADGLAPLPPLDVSGWYLRGNIDDDAQQASEGQTYLQPNFLADLASGAAAVWVAVRRRAGVAAASPAARTAEVKARLDGLGVARFDDSESRE